MALERLFARIDRIAGGRQAGLSIPAEHRADPRIRRAFTAISWLLILEVALGITAIVVALALQLTGHDVPWPVWMRTAVVLTLTLTLFYFVWRARSGYYWAYSRLRLFSKICPIVALVIAAIPGLYPVWLVTEQILFSIVLVGVADYLSSDYMRAAFPKPAGALRGNHGTTADTRR
jgi:hypothetical protein